VEEPLFTDVANESGLRFHHFLGSTGEFFFPETASAGAALVDYDGDGDLDVFLPQGTLLDPTKSLAEARFPPPETNWPGDRLFRNDSTATEIRFVDATSSSGLTAKGYGMGAAVGDYDGDGDADLYVTRFGSNSLYRNEGDGRFAEITDRAGVDDTRWSASASFVDYDRDGDLDLFTTNYVDFTVAGARPCSGPAGQRDYCGPMTYEPLPDRLFRNDSSPAEGDRFTDVTSSVGLHEAYGSGLGVVALDFDLDGWMDLYVANDQRANQLWHNLGGQGFENVGLLSGTAYNEDGAPEASMGVAAGDYDNDGDEDLLIAHLDGETNTLYRNLGGGTFVDATNELGLGSPSRGFTGFGAGWLDFDSDGVLDLFVANGAVKVIQSQQASPFPFRQRNLLFRGQESGRFEEIGERAGAALELSEVSRGAAFGDVDNDGDVDVLISNCNGPARLLRNDSQAGGWLSLVAGTALSGRKMGALVSVTTEDGRTSMRRLRTDGSYLSARDHRSYFGLGATPSAVAALEIEWPSGERVRLQQVPIDRAIAWSAQGGLP
jgi:hypothetical protein